MAANYTLGTKSASQAPEDRQVIANLLNPTGMTKKARICQIIGTAELLLAAEDQQAKLEEK